MGELLVVVTVFPYGHEFSANEDEEHYLYELALRLRRLESEGLIRFQQAWYWEQHEFLYRIEDRGRIILLFIGSYFLRHHGVLGWMRELERIERLRHENLRVIPIFLSKAARRRWEQAFPPEFDQLQALSEDVKPIEDWDDEEKALNSVVESIHKAIRDLHLDSQPPLEIETPESPPALAARPPRFTLPESAYEIYTNHNEILAARPPRFTLPNGSPPPRLAASPFRLPKTLGLILISVALLAGASVLIFQWVGGRGLLLIAQMLLLIITLCLIPTFVGLFVKPEKRVAVVTIESGLFSAFLVSFGFWFFSVSAIGPWIAYAVALIVLIEAGSNIVEWHKDTTLKRLSLGSSFQSIQGDARDLEKMFRYEVILYISVPLGLLIGTSIGFIRHEILLATILLCFQIFLFLASLVLLCFLVLGFQRMCDPIFKTASVVTPQITITKRPGLLLRVFEVLVPPPPEPLPVAEDPKQKDIDLACDVSELRKIYKYDMLHNAILLVALASAAVSIWGITIDVRWLIGLLLTATLLFSEVPYAIGQYLLHQKVLERYTGSTHAEMSKKLQEDVPLFPPLPIVAALMTAGTIGGFLFFLLNLFVQGALSPPK